MNRHWMLAAAALAYLSAAAVADPPDVPKRESPAQAERRRLWEEALRQAKENDPKALRGEAARMAAFLLKGSKANMGPGAGWFDPSRSRYSWAWLAERFDADKDGKVTATEFRGGSELFARLDRDRDAAITAEDLDWSERSPWVRQEMQLTQLFRAMDADGNGRVSREEWEDHFKAVAQGKDLLAEDLRSTLFPPMAGKGAKKGKKEDDAATRKQMLQAFMDGDAGSPHEGPRPGQPAPDFTLRTFDGQAKLTLSQYRGHKPVVLIFGSFT